MGVFLHEALAAASPRRHADALAADAVLFSTIHQALTPRAPVGPDHRADNIIGNAQRMASDARRTLKLDALAAAWQETGMLRAEVRRLCHEVAEFYAPQPADRDQERAIVCMSGVEVAVLLDFEDPAFPTLAGAYIAGQDVTAFLTQSQRDTASDLAVRAIALEAAKAQAERRGAN